MATAPQTSTNALLKRDHTVDLRNIISAFYLYATTAIGKANHKHRHAIKRNQQPVPKLCANNADPCLCF